MQYAPDDYLAFHCIASACRHSCCIGWEIDIDDPTRARYAAIGGELGARLAAAIEDGEEGAHFRLGADERCPMLRADGLCDLILACGEEALCQICADHPRFRNFFSGRTELGLGLCCEAAGAMLIDRRTPMRIVPLADDGDEALTAGEATLLETRAALMALAGDAAQSLDVRMAAICAHSGGEPDPRLLADWRPIYAALERLDPAWDSMLACLTDAPLPPHDEMPLARLLEYFLYRHLPAALDDGRIAERAAFAVLSVRVIRAIWCAGELTREALIEVARMYSSEIEYDEDNVEVLLVALADRTLAR